MGVLRFILLLLVMACIASVGVWAVHGDGARFGGIERSAQSWTSGDETTKVLTSDVVHVLVLNGTPVQNLAGEFSLLIDRAGCVADRIGNAPHDRYVESLLINRRLDDDRATALALRLGGPSVIREYDATATEDVVFVIGADHARLREILRAP